jgi:hypothetical protein
MPDLRAERRFIDRQDMIVHVCKCFIVKRHTWVRASCWLEHDMLYYQEASEADLGTHTAKILNLTKVPKCPGQPLFGLVDEDSNSINYANGDVCPREVHLVPNTILNDHGERVPDNCSVKWNNRIIPVIWTRPPLNEDGNFLEDDVPAVITDVEIAKSPIKGLLAPQLCGKVTVTAHNHSIEGMFLNPIDWHSLPAPMMQELSDKDSAVKKATVYRNTLGCCSSKSVSAGDAMPRQLHSRKSTVIVTQAPGKFVLALKKSKKKDNFLMCFDNQDECNEMKESIHTAWGRLRTGPGSHFSKIDLGRAGGFIGGGHGHMLRYQHWEVVHAEALYLERNIENATYKHTQTNSKTGKEIDSWWPTKDLTAKDAFAQFVMPKLNESKDDNSEEDISEDATSGIGKDVRYTLTDHYEENDIVCVKLEPCVRSWLSSGSTNYQDLEMATTVFMTHEKLALSIAHDTRNNSKFGGGRHML